MSPKVIHTINIPAAHTGSNRVSVALVIALITAISWIAWLTQVDRLERQEPFSEFYVKDSASLLTTNSLKLSENEEGTFTLVIANHEAATSNYRIHVWVNGRPISTVDNISLADDERHEEKIKFSFPIAGDNQRVDIFLEKQGSPFPYRSLHLLADVSSEEVP
jgi:uncharacterized membrane protein